MNEKKSNFKKLVEEKGYRFYGDNTIPVPDRIKGTLEFFKVKRYIYDDELEKEYTSRGLVAADPLTILDEISLNDERYIGTHWKDADNKWCFSTFNRWNDERGVYVNRNYSDWYDYLWFAGLRKSALSTSDTQTSLDTSDLDLCIQKVKEAGYQVSKILCPTHHSQKVRYWRSLRNMLGMNWIVQLILT
jgi:hypothetical protein